MCGRTKISLCAADVQGACAYKNEGDKFYKKPDWSDEYNLGKSYTPSYNVAPTEITPVLISASNFGIGESSEQIIKPMMWGMVPPWHKGSWKTHGLSTNNCRLEGVMSSRLYGSSLRDGNRCVVLAEGFYEWQTTNPAKQPHYIFLPQNESIQMDNLETWNNEFSDAKGWSGLRLMKMAALYDSWNCEDGTLYSYSIITMESNDTMSWLHHRMPAILDTDKLVADWLDTERVSLQKAISLLKPVSKLSSYPVSTIVNNSRNKSTDCNKQIKEDDVKVVKTKPRGFGSRSVMDQWLRGSSGSKRKEEAEPSSDGKKTKTDGTIK